jgi:hypothetical protein
MGHIPMGRSPCRQSRRWPGKRGYLWYKPSTCTAIKSDTKPPIKRAYGGRAAAQPMASLLLLLRHFEFWTDLSAHPSVTRRNSTLIPREDNDRSCHDSHITPPTAAQEQEQYWSRFFLKKNMKHQTRNILYFCCKNKTIQHLDHQQRSKNKEGWWFICQIHHFPSD